MARGNTTITTTTGGQGTDVTVSFDGYDTSVFPIHNKLNGTHNKCSTDYMTSDCSTMQVGAIHTDVLQFITPTSRDGRTVAQYYGNVDQTANINADDIKLTATGVSGDRLATAEDNSNQAATGDDHAGSATTVRTPARTVRASDTRTGATARHGTMRARAATGRCPTAVTGPTVSYRGRNYASK